MNSFEKIWYLISNYGTTFLEGLAATLILALFGTFVGLLLGIIFALIKDIKIKEVVKIGDRYYIKGQNFTQYSKVTMDGKTLKTIYLGESVLGLLEEVDPEDAPNMKVSQIENKSKEILSTTE